jgi:hypothetical protein
MKKTMKKSELKKIDTVHNAIDNLLNDSKIIHSNIKLNLPKEELFYEEKPITKDNIIQEEIQENIKPIKEIKERIISTAVEKDIHSDDVNSVNDKSSSDLLRAMEILHNPENLESNTILNNPQVIAMSVINYLAQAYDINFFKVFVKTFPRYRISGDDGRGRKEMIEIANAIQRNKEEEHQRFMEVLGRR